MSTVRALQPAWTGCTEIARRIVKITARAMMVLSTVLLQCFVPSAPHPAIN